MNERLVSLYRDIRNWLQGRETQERTLELLGSMFSALNAEKTGISSLHEVEFRVFSQWGDDGIIQWLISQMPEMPKRFIEFGVEDYSEATTRFLLVNNNWQGLVMDGSSEKIARLKKRKWFWRHELTAISKFLTKDNVDEAIRDWNEGKEIGILHIDVDGNDYWLWEAIQCIEPTIVIVEYNSLFGPERAITIPYRADFRRHLAHYSGQYAGASLAALTALADRKGYSLIGCNSAGNNAYYVHSRQLTAGLRTVPVDSAYVESRFRDSRDQNGSLTHLSFTQRQSLIRGLHVVNVRTGNLESF
ncbi:MAG: hypothetical protein ACOY6E_01110 [Pseudomonadota bacterium]